MSLPVLVLALFGGFLFCLGSAAVGIGKAARGSGERPGGCAGGCAAFLGVFFVLFLGLVGTGAFLVATAVGAAVEHNPIERVEFDRGPRPGPGEDPDPLRARVSMQVLGELGQEIVDALKEAFDGDGVEHRLVRRTVEGDVVTTLHEFTLPITGHELYELEAELLHELDGLDVELPETVRVDLQTLED